MNVELTKANLANEREWRREVGDLAPRNTDDPMFVSCSTRPLGRLVSNQPQKGPALRTIDVPAARTGRFAPVRVIRVSQLGRALQSSHTAS